MTLRPRVIPILLLQNQGLVKTVRFKHPKYIGDPINAVKIFNNLQADELTLLDIDAYRQGRLIDSETVKMVGEEANMPFSVGGGIRSLNDIQKLLAAGAERVVIGTSASMYPQFIRNAANEFGSSTISVCMDVRNFWYHGNCVVALNASKRTNFKPLNFAILMEEMGAGEIIVQSVDRDGTYSGYDLELVRSVSETVSIQVVALGGARDYRDLQRAFGEAYASGVAAGSLFVYQGVRRGVLISYPANILAELFP